MKNELLRVAVYIRVSSDEQAENGDSIRDQRERCTRYINEHDDMILQDIYVDDGISGQKLERDDFQRLLQNVTHGQVDRIIFTKLDRWFRSLRHYLNTQAILDKYNVGWTAIDQPYFDTSTPYGRAFVAQSMTWAELEAQNGGQRVKDVFKTKVQHGEAITGKIPRCYKIENKHLVFSEQAPAIHDSIQHFLDTQSIYRTIQYMHNVHNISMTQYNFKKSYLRNELLTGRYRGIDDYCPKLISDEMFQKIQEILNRNMNIKSNQCYPYIFSGLLVCNECGHKLAGCKIIVNKTKADGSICKYTYPAYECKLSRINARCSNGTKLQESVIEQYLLNYLDNGFNNYIAEYETVGKMITDNRAKKAKLRQKLDRLKDLYLNEIISLDEYRVDRISLEQQLSDIPDIDKPQRNINDLKKILGSDFKNLYQGFSNEEKRKFWRSILKEVRVSKGNKKQRSYYVVPL